MKEDIALRVRPGTPEDYEAVLAIQRRAYELKEAPLYGPDLPPLKETPATLAAELANAGRRLLVGEVAGRVAASLRMEAREDGSAYFCRLSVDPGMQGLGIGRRMVAAFEEANAGAREFVLDCGENSAENLHLYGKLGYRPTGESFRIPGGPRVLVMKKKAGGTA